MSDAQSAYDGFISYSHAADDQLAPRLQAGLQRFAKPWWQRRALRIFRDESSLAANPHLWSSITDALDDAGWFVLLLSPDAAESEWVNQEVAYWLEHREADRIIPVVTSGEFGWDGSDVSGDCVPDALRGVFESEPRWVDARELGDPETLDLQNPEFAAVVADLAAPLRGVPKDELAGEEVRQHKRTVRTAWAAGVVVLVFGVAAVGFGIQAAQNAAEAERQAEIADANAADADEQRGAAEANAAEAERQAEIASANAEEAERQAGLARAGELGAAALGLVDSDPALARELALEAVDEIGSTDALPVSVIDALWGSQLADRLTGVIDTGRPGFTIIDVAPDESRIIVVSEVEKTAAMYALPDGELLWEYVEPSAEVMGGIPRFSPDGSQVVISPWVPPGSGSDDGAGNRALILDAGSGDIVRELRYPDCFSASGWGWSADGSRFLVADGPVPCPRAEAPDGTWVEVLETDDWTTLTVIDGDDPGGLVPEFADDGRLYVFGATSPTVVYDSESYSPVAVLEESMGYGSVRRDGTKVVAAEQQNLNVRLVSTETGLATDLLDLDTRAAPPVGAAFDDGGVLVGVTGTGDRTAIWDASSGRQLFSLPSGPGNSLVFGPDGKTAYTSHPDGSVRIWNLGAKTVNTEIAGDLGDADFINGNSFGVGFGVGVAQGIDQSDDSCAPIPFCSYAVIFDPETGTLLDRSFPAYGSEPWPSGDLAYSLGGGWYVGDGGPEDWLVAGCPSADFETCEGSGEPLLDTGVLVSVDGTEAARDVGFYDDGGYFEIVDPSDGAVVGRIEGTEFPGGEAALAFGSDWVLTATDSPVGDSMVFVVDRANLEVILEASVDGRIEKDELSPSGRRLAFDTSEGRVFVLEVGTWESVAYDLDIGNIRGMAFLPDEESLAVSDENRFYIIDLESGLIQLSVPFAGVSDFHFLDEETFVFGTNDGLWGTLSLAVDDLVAAARNPDVPRQFTPQECFTYGLECEGDG